MPKRSRLKKNGSKLKQVDARLKRRVATELKGLPTSRVKKYATLSDKAVFGSPVLSLTKSEAIKELASRQHQTAVWKKGQHALAPKEKLLPKIAKGAKKVSELAGKGFQEYMKVITGQKARELEETIATIGMKPEEKKKTLERLKKERADTDDFEIFPSQPVDDTQFGLDKATADINKELKQARKEAGL